MIVSHKYKYIFLKTRKTASTGVEIALSQFCGASDIITPILPQDEELRNSLGFKGPQNCFIPIGNYSKADRLELFKTYRRKKYYDYMTATELRQALGEEIWGSYFKFCFERNPYDKAISRYLLSIRPLQRRPSIEEYLEKTQLEFLSNWEIYAIKNKIAVDYVGKYEQITDDLKVLSARIGLPEEITLPTTRGRSRKKRKHYSEILGLRERVLIEQACKREINFFSYHWGY